MTFSSLERIRKAARLEQPDVVPVAPYMGNHGAKVGGALISELPQRQRSGSGYIDQRDS